MTRKESGWVSEAMGLIGAYCQECAAQPDPNARRQREALNAINSHLTSLQSAAEGLEEALRKANRAPGDPASWLDEAVAALSAFNAIKEKQQ